MGDSHDRESARLSRRVIKLGPGIRLSADHERSETIIFVLGASKVHLNRHALAILELCDGSRSRDRVVVDAMLRSSGTLRTTDVVEFLDAALARGWIVEDG
jgi:hypothetical protein